LISLTRIPEGEYPRPELCRSWGAMLHELNKLSLKTQNEAQLRVAAGILKQSLWWSNP